MRFHALNKAVLGICVIMGVNAVTACPSALAACEGGPSKTLRLNGLVSNPKTFTPETLGTYKPTKTTLSFFSGASGMVTKTYVGVPLYDLIQEAGLVTDPNRKNDKLRKYVQAAATDCYQAALSYGEIDPGYAGGYQPLVAYAYVDAAGIQLPLEDSEGAVRLIVPSDKFGGRQLSNLKTLTVRTAP